MKAFNFTKQTVKRLTCALLCALTITTVGCSKEEPNAPEETERHVIARASFPENDPITRLVYPTIEQPQWENDDVFGVWKDRSPNVSEFKRTELTGPSTTAQFEGTITCRKNDYIYASYPKMETVYDNSIEIGQFYKQGTSIAENAHLHGMWAVSKLNEDGTIDFAFKHTVAMMKIKLEGTGIPKSLVIKASYELTGQGSLVLTPTGLNTGFSQQMIPIEVEGDFVDKTAYIFLYPFDELKSLEMEITDINGKVVPASLGAKTVVPGTIYEVTVPFNPAP